MIESFFKVVIMKQYTNVITLFEIFWYSMQKLLYLKFTDLESIWGGGNYVPHLISNKWK